MRRPASFFVAAGVLLGLVLLRPVIVAPVTGDDVYYALGAASEPDRTVVGQVTNLRDEWTRRIAKGRVNVLTFVERRTTGRAMVEAAVATGRPVHQVLAVQRVGYALLSLFAVYALIRSLRWRRRDSGRLVALHGRTRTLAMVAGGLTFAAGAQPQIVGLHGWNGWLSYPVSTWTAAFSIFGVVALALWLARLSVGRGWRVGVPVAVLFAAIGALTNFRYELTFAALPLTIIALATIPVSDRQQQAAGRKAKIVVGSAYLAGFIPVSVLTRTMVSDLCKSGDCYEGVSLSLSPSLFPAFVRNVVSSVPGTGVEEVQALLRAESVPTQGAWLPTLWSVLTALAVLATLMLLWWRSGAVGGLGTPVDSPGRRAEATLCLVGAALLTLGGLGAAAIMSLSEAAQQRSEIGILSRHSVVTWIGLAFAIVLVVLALGLMRPRLAAPSFTALGLVLACVVATKLPADERTMTANTRRMDPTMRVFDEVVRGERGRDADQRRCRVLRSIDDEMSAFYARRIRSSSERAFQRFWQVPFCAQEASTAPGASR